MSVQTAVPPVPPETADPERGADAAVATLVVAFAADPVIRWLLPGSHQYLEHFPELVRVMTGQAFVEGTVDRGEGGAATAAWLRPGTVVPQDDAVALLQRSVDPRLFDDAMAFLAVLDDYHPTEPHWYLPFMGVDPVAQGRGVGAALLRAGTARADEDGRPAYLEASSPRNRALYERHGFDVLGEVQAAGSPPLWPMIRRAD